MIYLMNYLIINGHLISGKLIPSFRVCMFSLGGIENPVNPYEAPLISCCKSLTVAEKVNKSV